MRALRVACARPSCISPSAALNSSSSAITAASRYSRSMNCSTIAASSIHGTGAHSFASRRRQAGGSLSGMVLEPYACRRTLTSALLSPGWSAIKRQCCAARSRCRPPARRVASGACGRARERIPQRAAASAHRQACVAARSRVELSDRARGLRVWRSLHAVVARLEAGGLRAHVAFATCRVVARLRASGP